MNIELTEALKAHHQRLNWRMLPAATLPVVSISLARWLFDLNSTQQRIVAIGAFVGSAILQIECRLKTMQIRLARMEDQIRHGEWIRDPENHDHQISELSGW
jgi:hypothetical protein